MRKLLFLSLILILIGSVSLKKEEIIDFLEKYIIKNKEIVLDEKNKYYRDYDFNFVQNTHNFSPYSKQDILNIYYTAINAGKDEFTFYCPKNYSNCLSDVKTLANDQEALSNINNFVHPFNGFSHIETEYDNLGKVIIKIDKSYNNNEIELIEKEIDKLLLEITNSSMSEKDKIRSIHDYIINNTKYDNLKSDIDKYKLDIAYGPLFEGYAICGGYTDLMELFLERLKIKSFKISSNNHIWNALFIDNNWYHLDLTWDDPVASDGSDYLEHNYFLITTKKLLNLDLTEHQFNEEIFSELKEA